MAAFCVGRQVAFWDLFFDVLAIDRETQGFRHLFQPPPEVLEVLTSDVV